MGDEEGECELQKQRHVKERFGNCELREYIMHWSSDARDKQEGKEEWKEEWREDNSSKKKDGHVNISTTDNNDGRPVITLTEVTPGTNIHNSDNKDD
uniref:Uncharacterized protein n=1 Tax=Helicotheca tamesis TaxID=374047 RepID=A0A7S2HFP1_9STRA